MTDPATAQQEWENAYAAAMQARDWLTCEILLDERETADWYVPDEPIAGVVERVSAYTEPQT